MSDLQFTGRETFNVPRDVLFSKLVDLDFIAGGMKNVVSVDKKSDTSMVCKIKPTLSFLSGTLDVAMEVLEKDPPQSARMKVQGKGIGASLEIETSMELSPTDDGKSCELAWTSQVTQLGGLLKSVSKSLIQAAAAKMSQETWGDLHRRLDAE